MKLWTDRNYPIIISCAKGLAPWTDLEVRRLGYQPVETALTRVVVRGAMRDVFRLNLGLRTAHRVMVPLLRARCFDRRRLYELVTSIDWENILEPDGYFTVHSVVHNSTIRDTRIPSLVTKDAIADRMTAYCGRRPDSGGEMTGASIFVYWEDDTVLVYIDTTGEALSRRGYRRIPGSAPLQETLAAACIMGLRWDPSTPFVAPMCGSGTPAIEAALMACNRAPGSFKSHFGFMSIKGYRNVIPGESAEEGVPGREFGVSPERIWKEMAAAAGRAERRDGLPRIIATDISPEAVENAHTNAVAAGVADMIEFKACDYRETEIPEARSGAVFFNPEYGIRLGTFEELVPVYEGIGDFMKNNCPHYTGGVLTGSPELARRVGLRPSARIEFHNGPIECRLLVFPLYPANPPSAEKTEETIDGGSGEGQA